MAEPKPFLIEIREKETERLIRTHEIEVCEEKGLNYQSSDGRTRWDKKENVVKHFERISMAGHEIIVK